MDVNAIAPDASSNDQEAASLNVDVSSVEKRRNQSASACSENSVLLLDRRALDRDCLARSLEANDPDLDIMPYASLEDWNAANEVDIPSVVVFVIGGLSLNDDKTFEMICEITKNLPDSPLIVIADTDDIGQMLKAVEHGAGGFIPSSVGVNVAVEAIRLARAGGVFLPASGILAVRNLIETAINDTCGPGSLFTPREVQVAEALRRGKANKIIAYELDLCESTVKVHIRNIMKKLNATNRTEVAYKLREVI